MVEWSKAQHWKCCEGATSPRVRIPLSPPFFYPPFNLAEKTILDIIL